MDREKSFENWFAGDATGEERERMLETNPTGGYKLMQAHSDFRAFMAGMNAYQNSLVEKYEKALVDRSCDIPAFETVLLYYFDSTTLIPIKEKLLAKHGIDLNT